MFKIFITAVFLFVSLSLSYAAGQVVHDVKISPEPRKDSVYLNITGKVSRGTRCLRGHVYIAFTMGNRLIDRRIIVKNYNGLTHRFSGGIHIKPSMYNKNIQPRAARFVCGG